MKNDSSVDIYDVYVGDEEQNDYKFDEELHSNHHHHNQHLLNKLRRNLPKYHLDQKQVLFWYPPHHHNLKKKLKAKERQLLMRNDTSKEQHPHITIILFSSRKIKSIACDAFNGYLFLERLDLVIDYFCIF